MTETVKITAADGAEQDYFGRSASLSGDTVAASALGNDVSGSACIFGPLKPVAWLYLPVVLRSAP